ncbi:MAG: NHL repeat-containing protein [Acidobacteriota bacterium]
MGSTELSRSVRLGAAATGGLALPDAQPSPSQLYAPRGVYLDERRLIAVDSGNHRVMIWHGAPSHDGAPAEVVLGQPSAYSEGPRAGGRGAENGFHLPTAAAVHDDRLFVADAWHHRILVWNEVPTVSDTPPDWALGQDDLADVEPNRGAGPSRAGLYWPYGFGYLGGVFYVADTGNRRVLAWHGLPTRDRPADFILGQPADTAGEENRGGAAAADSFRWPHAFAACGDTLFVADAGNHRLLGWSPPPNGDRPADVVVGQSDFTTAREFPYAPQSARSLRFPYGITSDGTLLAVADTANNRVLLFHDSPRGAGGAADAVLAQPDFAANGENRWQAVEDDSLCWPYGLWLHGSRLAVADSGNNRVLLWDLSRAAVD